MRKSCQPYNSTVRDHNNSKNATPKPPDASQRTIGLSNRTTYWLQLLRDKRENIRGERDGREGIQADWLVIISLHISNHNMEHAFCPLPFFFFCFGGWRTTLIAASKTPFTFCSLQAQIYKWKSRHEKDPKHYAIDNLNTCCVFELHSIYAGAPISFLSSSP